MDNKQKLIEIEEQQRRLESFLDDICESAMQKVDELIKDARKLKEKYQS